MKLLAGVGAVVCSLSLSSECDRAGDAPAAPPAVAITTLSPASGPVGTTVELTGTGFAPTENVVKFGVGYLANLTSADGKTLRFVVPEHHEVCPPAVLESNAPCAEMHPRVMPGEYPVSLVTRTEKSRELVFTVTAR